MALMTHNSVRYCRSWNCCGTLACKNTKNEEYTIITTLFSNDLYRSKCPGTIDGENEIFSPIRPGTGI